MRQLTNHIVQGDSANHQLKINVIDEPGHGGACHFYTVDGYNADQNSAAPLKYHDDIGQGLWSLYVIFQNGPIKEVGVNGVTHEALLAILIDRLESFQAGPYACEDNDDALDDLKSALCCLQRRTHQRIARSVEGTHEI